MSTRASFLFKNDKNAIVVTVPHGFNLITAYGSTARLIATRIRSIWPIDKTIYYNMFRLNMLPVYSQVYGIDRSFISVIREAANDVNMALSIDHFSRVSMCIYKFGFFADLVWPVT